MDDVDCFWLISHLYAGQYLLLVTGQWRPLAIDRLRLTAILPPKTSGCPDLGGGGISYSQWTALLYQGPPGA